jgi:hypothetical protein
MATFKDHESVDLLEGQNPGDSFKRLQRVTREEDGEVIEFVALKDGYIDENEDGSTEEVYTDSTSLGSPEYIDELAEAIKDLDEKINK